MTIDNNAGKSLGQVAYEAGSRFYVHKTPNDVPADGFADWEELSTIEREYWEYVAGELRFEIRMRLPFGGAA